MNRRNLPGKAAARATARRRAVAPRQGFRSGALRGLLGARGAAGEGAARRGLALADLEGRDLGDRVGGGDLERDDGARAQVLGAEDELAEVEVLAGALDRLGLEGAGLL